MSGRPASPTRLRLSSRARSPYHSTSPRRPPTDDELHRAVRHGDVRLLTVWLPLLDESQYAQALAEAAEQNQERIVRLLLTRAPSMDMVELALQQALNSNSTETALLLIQSAIESNFGLDWSLIATQACQRGNVILMQHLITQVGLPLLQSGSTYFSLPVCLRAALLGNHVDLTTWLLNQGVPFGAGYDDDELANMRELDALDAAYRQGHFLIADFPTLIYFAAKENNGNLVNYLFHLGGDVNEILEGAAAGGHKQLLYSAIERGATAYNDALDQAIDGDEIKWDTIYTLIAAGADNWDTIGVAASILGDEGLFRLALLRGADPNGLLESATQDGQERLVQFALRRGATDLSSALLAACSAGHVALAQFFLTLDPTLDRERCYSTARDYFHPDFQSELEAREREAAQETQQRSFSST